MSKTLRRALIITLSMLFVFLASTCTTLALLFDRTVNSGIIQFSQHKLDITIVGGETIKLSPEELVIGAQPTRTLNITNPMNSTSCVMRLWVEFYVEGELNTEYLTLTMNESFTQSDSGKFYYNSVIGSGQSLNNVQLTFNIENVPASNYEGKNYSIRLCIESMQPYVDAIKEWENDYSTEWRNNINSQLL